MVISLLEVKGNYNQAKTVVSNHLYAPKESWPGYN